jgi:hypothetical protein
LRRTTTRQCEAAGAGWLGGQIGASDSALRTSSSLEVGRDGCCDDVKRFDVWQAVRRRYVHLFRSCLGRGRTLSRHTQTVLRLNCERWPGTGTGVRTWLFWSRDTAGVVVRKRATQLRAAARKETGKDSAQRLLGAAIIPRSSNAAQLGTAAAPASICKR